MKRVRNFIGICCVVWLTNIFVCFRWPIRLGGFILGGASVISSVYITNTFRRKFKLKNIGRPIIIVPTIVSPIILGPILHQHVISIYSVAAALLELHVPPKIRCFKYWFLYHYRNNVLLIRLPSLITNRSIFSQVSCANNTRKSSLC